MSPGAQQGEPLSGERFYVRPPWQSPPNLAATVRPYRARYWGTGRWKIGFAERGQLEATRAMGPGLPSSELPDFCVLCAEVEEEMAGRPTLHPEPCWATREGEWVVVLLLGTPPTPVHFS